MVSRANVPWVTRLFVWSVALDPLLFFVIADRSRFGVTFALSRVLQVAVMALLAGQAAVRWRRAGWDGRRLAPWPRVVSAWAFTFFVLAVLAGAVGLVRGAYLVPNVPDFNARESLMARTLNAADFRPVIEYAILVFNFAYFVVLARYLLDTTARVHYAYDAFRRLFVLSLGVGLLELAALPFGFPGVPRHLADGVLVGNRFHGLAGEPRHAAAYLMLGAAIIGTDPRADRRWRWWMWSLVAAAWGLTQSGSGVIALACFFGCLLLWMVRRAGRREALLALAAVGVVAVVGAAAASRSSRLQEYWKATEQLASRVDGGAPPTGLLVYQKAEVLPLLDLAAKVRGGDWLPVLVGSGLGSASAATNRLGGDVGLANPNSGLARVLYATGLVGLTAFVFAVLTPVRVLSVGLPAARRRRLAWSALLVVGAAMGVWSAAPFIYLGITVAGLLVESGTRADGRGVPHA